VAHAVAEPISLVDTADQLARGFMRLAVGFGDSKTAQPLKSAEML
jgi:hypothetical protein